MTTRIDTLADDTLADTTAAAGSETRLSLPVQAPQGTQHNAQAQPATPTLVARLVEQCGASWVDVHSVDAWAREGGDRVVLFAGDPVRFPEGVDVAVVLPELQRCFPGRFHIGVVQRQLEDALARKYGSQRWPTLLFLRDGHYVTTVSGMHDWDVFQKLVADALAAPVSRAPTIGIPVVNANATDSHCN